MDCGIIWKLGYECVYLQSLLHSISFPRAKKSIYICICVLTFSLKYQIQIMEWGKVVGEEFFIHSTHRT